MSVILLPTDLKKKRVVYVLKPKPTRVVGAGRLVLLFFLILKLGCPYQSATLVARTFALCERGSKFDHQVSCVEATQHYEVGGEI